MATVAQTIIYGDATVFLMANYEASGALFGTKLVKPQSPQLVALITDALRWQYEGQPTDTTLQGTADYLYWLCGMFQLEARALTGGGSVTPIPPASNIPNPVEFVVDASTSPIVDGNSTLIIPQFIGYNVIFNRNNIPQAQLNTAGTYFSWNKVTGLFQCFGVAATDELFSINAV